MARVYTYGELMNIIDRAYNEGFDHGLAGRDPRVDRDPPPVEELVNHPVQHGERQNVGAVPSSRK